LSGLISRSGIVRLPELRPALQAVTQLVRATRSGVAHPSILLVGPTGSGKSRLGEYAETKVSRLGIDARTFTCREFHEIPEAEETPSVDQPYPVRPEAPDLSEPQLLILEDLPFLPARSVVRLIQLLDQREQLERPTLMTSVRSPSEIDQLPNRLLGRLAGFLVISIPTLSQESRLLFLNATYPEKHLLTSNALVWMASRANSLRELVAIPNQLEPLKRFSPPPWDVPTLTDFFQGQQTRPRPTLEALAVKVAERYALRWKELLGKSRVRNIVRARHIAMSLARRKGYSLKEIGTYFGKRDHKSVSHAVESIEKLLKEDVVFERQFAELLGS